MLKSIHTYYFSFLFILVISISGFCQELPPIQIFNPEDYHGDNQNWMISQSSDKYIYVANNKGLLEFNGAEWQMYPSPNNTIIRAVKVVADRIYTGCYMDFGYWQKDLYGKLIYTSLKSKLNEEMVEDEQIWHILPYSEWIIFQSFDKIYFYNTQTEKFKIIHSDNLIFNVFEVNETIFYQVQGEGIYKVEDGVPKIFLDTEVVKNQRVINLDTTPEGLILLTRESGFYKYENNFLYKWHTEVDSFLDNTSIYNGLKLSDDSFILGTISNGVINLRSDGSINFHITQKNGLSNNTALSLFEDFDKNLWVGLDNGINCINVTSPIKVYFDFDGELGTVYCSKVFKGYIYLGTNQGLFFKKLTNKDPFKFIEGTAGQVWDLFNYKNETLLCGHHLGTYIIDVDKATLVDNNLGAWTFKGIPFKEDLLLRGNYNGLSILENSGNKWKLKNRISGFDNSSRFFEIDSTLTGWVGHEYKGVFKLKLNDSLTKVINQSMEPSLSVGKNSSIIKYKNDILYAFEKGVYKYNIEKEKFERDSILSPIISESNYTSGKLIVDEKGRLWTFSKDNIYFISNDHLTTLPKIDTISIPSGFRKMILGYENISLLDDDIYLLGTANGYLTIDISKIKKDETFKIYLDKVTLKDKNDNVSYYNPKEKKEFEYNQGLLLFDYAVPNYNKYTDTQYQYILEGHLNKWSDWTNDSKVQFENLSFGNYTFRVKAKVGNAETSNNEIYHFIIKRPWYLSNLALLLYFLLLILIGFVVHRAYKRHYHKKLKRKQLESDQLIMHIKNEQLNSDIESKNRELTISKMSIIKKNELLNAIKKELNDEDIKPSKNIRSVVKLIDKNLNNTKDWEFFVKAFNNTDKGFLDRLKVLHPDLTPNDLRFCVYLRMNLSSKEIAPLLNISVKSVETKRYRLRKRMNLPHEESLVNYIMDI